MFTYKNIMFTTGLIRMFGSYPEGHKVSQQNHNDYVTWFLNLVNNNENSGGNKDE